VPTRTDEDFRLNGTRANGRYLQVRICDEDLTVIVGIVTVAHVEAQLAAAAESG
jgi:hypothetical protein